MLFLGPISTEHGKDGLIYTQDVVTINENFFFKLEACNSEPDLEETQDTKIVAVTYPYVLISPYSAIALVQNSYFHEQNLDLSPVAKIHTAVSSSGAWRYAAKPDIVWVKHVLQDTAFRMLSGYTYRDLTLSKNITVYNYISGKTYNSDIVETSTIESKYDDEPILAVRELERAFHKYSINKISFVLTFDCWDKQKLKYYKLPIYIRSKKYYNFLDMVSKNVFSSYHEIHIEIKEDTVNIYSIGIKSWDEIVGYKQLIRIGVHKILFELNDVFSAPSLDDCSHLQDWLDSYYFKYFTSDKDKILQIISGSLFYGTNHQLHIEYSFHGNLAYKYEISYGGKTYAINKTNLFIRLHTYLQYNKGNNQEPTYSPIISCVVLVSASRYQQAFYNKLSTDSPSGDKIIKFLNSAILDPQTKVIAKFAGFIKDLLEYIIIV